jgi:hypothetical protein
MTASTFRPPNFVGLRRSGPHRINQGLAVEFEFAAGELRTIWDPDVPQGLSKRGLRLYRQHRDRFLHRIGLEVGKRMAVAELEPDGDATLFSIVGAEN